MKNYLRLLPVILLAGSVQMLFAQSGGPSVQVVNKLNNKTVQLSAEQLKALPHVRLSIMGNDEQMHTYTGVPLSQILQQAGVAFGSGGKKLFPAVICW